VTIIDSKPSNLSWAGVASAFSAFLIWGLSPIFYKALAKVPPLEILMHRMVWSFIFLIALLFLLGRWKTFFVALKNRRTLCILLSTTLLVGYNWFVFIWAINNGHIIQASLGYYINPLVNMLLAMLFLGERLRRLQIVAAVIALGGVIYLTFSLGQFPWVALTLAFSFAFYGLIRKVAPVSALEGLSIETMLFFIPATAYLCYLESHGTGAFLRFERQTDLLLMASALVTAVPLLLFTVGARRLTFISISFMQYLAPSCNFFLAVFLYREPFSAAQAITFALIWTALALFSLDAVVVWRKYRRLTS
jgi:chloramphenicol-sensitive protein RarD